MRASKHVHLEKVCAYICAHPARRRACACARNERVCASVAALSVCAREGQSESSGRACVVLGGGSAVWRWTVWGEGLCGGVPRFHAPVTLWGQHHSVRGGVSRPGVPRLRLLKEGLRQ